MQSLADKLGLFDGQKRRARLLPASELIHVIEEIYMLRRRETGDIRELVVQYFNERFRGKVGKEKAEDFWYTVGVGKKQGWEVKGFVKVVSGEWPTDVLSLYDSALSQLEALTHSKLSLSTLHLEYLGDSHSSSTASLYLSPAQCLSLMSSVCRKCGRRYRAASPTCDISGSELIYTLLDLHLKHV